MARAQPNSLQRTPRYAAVPSALRPPGAAERWRYVIVRGVSLKHEMYMPFLPLFINSAFLSVQSRSDLVSVACTNRIYSAPKIYLGAGADIARNHSHTMDPMRAPHNDGGDDEDTGYFRKPPERSNNGSAGQRSFEFRQH